MRGREQVEVETQWTGGRKRELCCRSKKIQVGFRKEATQETRQMSNKEAAIGLSPNPPRGPRPPGSRQVVVVGSGGVQVQREGAPGAGRSKLPFQEAGALSLAGSLYRSVLDVQLIQGSLL